MWDYVRLPRGKDSSQEEKRIEALAAEKMREYNGTVFLCVSRSDQARRRAFQQAARSLGYTAQDGWAVCTAYSAEALAKRPGKNVLFVEAAMRQYLGEYLDACPAGARHLLLYSRRFSNGPTPCMSLFMDFWMERGVDILDLCYAGQKPEEVVECCSGKLVL